MLLGIKRMPDSMSFATTIFTIADKRELSVAAALLSAGAGYAQIALFISTLMMVGVATMPLEARYFGKATALKRNMLSLAAALVSSMILGDLI